MRDSTMLPTQISGYDKSSFTAPLADGHEVTHDVYTRGEGPPVVLIQEMPGIGQETLRLADKLIEAGFSVVMPHLFGPLGKTAMLGNLLRVMCLRREFSLLATNRSSPIADWLKALCRKVKDDFSVKGVGVIGMCLTGNLAITLMADESVLASVASQPAMPLNDTSKLQMSEDEVAATCARIDATAPMKALRFEKDPSCNAARFKAIDEAFNTGGVTRVEQHVLPGKGHSVLTVDFVDEQGHPTHQALEAVIAYFRSQLRVS